MQRQEDFHVGKYRILRNGKSYVISKGSSREITFTRFHSAVDALSEHFEIFYFKGDYSERLINFNALPKRSSELEPIDVDEKLSQPVTWGSAVAGSAAGVIMASIIEYVWRLEKSQRRRIAELSEDIPEDVLDEIRKLSPSNYLAKALQAHFQQIPRFVRNTAGVHNFADAVGPQVALQIAAVEGNYMRQAGSVGTAIHSILELVSRNAMEVGSVRWPTSFVNKSCRGIDEDLIERARVTWETTVATLNFEAENIVAVEPVIIVNHSNEGIAGAADLILLLNDEIVIVDWKTAKKMTSRADYAIQVATYSLASRILCEDGDIFVSHPDILSRQERQEAQDEMTRLLIAGDVDAATEIAYEIQESTLNDKVGRSVATLPDGTTHLMANYAVLVRVDSAVEDANVYKVDISGSIREFVLRLLHTNEVVTEAKLARRVRQMRRPKVS